SLLTHQTTSTKGVDRWSGQRRNDNPAKKSFTCERSSVCSLTKPTNPKGKTMADQTTTQRPGMRPRQLSILVARGPQSCAAAGRLALTARGSVEAIRTRQTRSNRKAGKLRGADELHSPLWCAGRRRVQSLPVQDSGSHADSSCVRSFGRAAGWRPEKR